MTKPCFSARSYHCLFVAGIALLLAETTFVRAADVVKLDVFPPRIMLDGPKCEVQLIVTGITADGREFDLTKSAEIIPGNEAVAKVRAGRIMPLADGKSEVIIRAAELQVRVPVEVVNSAAQYRVSFQNETLPALSKQGCNSGACHGAPSGKGGFRLSLRAYDPALDEQTLLREWFSRRTNVLAPEQSLLLLKPLMRVSHGGGQKLKKTDFAYQLLYDWIDQGCQADPTDGVHVVRLDLYPSKRTLHAPHVAQQMLALATYSDGSRRDVTRITVFTSSDGQVANVDEAGRVTGYGRGESVILGRYLDQMATSSLTFFQGTPNFAWTNPPAHNYVDTHVFAKLQDMQILPSDLCTDGDFLRRVYLDVLGVLPSAEEARAFLADPDPAKRVKVIDTLLERPEYVDLWALKWADLLRVRNRRLSSNGVYKFHHWLLAAVRNNLPYDQFARQLLTADGSTFINPPANYFRAATDMLDCTETTSQLFLGIRINCAKCHNHPFEKWTQDNYYGLAAFFNRVGRKPGSTPDEQVVWMQRSGEVTQPRTGKQMQPWLPLVGNLDLTGEEDRREQFVEWLIKSENPFFAKVGVNRLWAHLIGRGIVEPVDDFRESNPPSNPSLLTALADDFVNHGYDCKHMLRTILNSGTYQLSSQVNTFNTGDTKYFSHALARLMPAEQLLDAISQVTAVPDKFSGVPEGSRAMELPSPDETNDFMRIFGQTMRETACACERTSEPILSQALQMINGPLVLNKIKAKDNRLYKMMHAEKPDADIVNELYLTALCRPANASELATAADHVGKAPNRLLGLEEVCWAILNSNEFLFQH